MAKAIADKLIKAWHEIGNIPKNGRNPRFNYSFVREEDAANAVRVAFSKVRLSVIPSVMEITRSVIKTKDSEMQHVLVKMKFTLTDPDTGETDNFDMYGEACDSFDKATYKAITGATKYAYLKLALSGAGDDDAEESDGQDRHQRTDAKSTQQQTIHYRAPKQQDKKEPPKEAEPEQQPGQQPDRNKVNTGGSSGRMETNTGGSGKTEQSDSIPIMEDVGRINAVLPALKNKPASLTFKPTNTSFPIIVITFDPKAIDVPKLLKLQASKSEVEIRCDVSSGQPHLMAVEEKK